MVTTIYAGERAPPPETIPQPGAWRALCPATDKELARLLAMVRAKYPRLVPCDDQGFAVAFAFQNSCGRTEQPDRRYYSSRWGELAEEFAYAVRAPKRNVAEMVFAAVIAAGDVPFLLQSSGVSAAIGLAEHGGRRAGKALVPSADGSTLVSIDVTPAWKQILAGTRSMLEPVSPPDLPYASRPVTIREYRHYRDRDPCNPDHWKD